ncbi:MAG: Ig-like domain-containing protein, partial [Flavobacteriaceae bacterium]
MLKRVFVALLICSVFVQCARRGSPTGGPKDETPPVMLRAEPPQQSVQFKEDRIRIYFDEYIKLNKLNDQLVVSPPLEQTAYVISPQSQAAKYVEIEFLDSLAQNTTYTFNFGESVVDNNEGNPFSYFSYVFSTGATIDSLTLRGTISDAFSRT